MATGDPSPLQDLRVQDFVLPPDVSESGEAAQVKMIDLFGVAVVDSPGLTGIEERDNFHCKVDLQPAKASPLRSWSLSRSLPKAELALAIFVRTQRTLYKVTNSNKKISFFVSFFSFNNYTFNMNIEAEIPKFSVKPGFHY